MTTDKFPELKQAIQNFENENFIFPFEESDEGKDHHAEMNIIRFIYENENSGEFYIGISKLSCVNCYNVIYSFSEREQLDIFIRGAHKFEFNSRQPTIWEKRSESEKFEYFPPETSRENSTPLFADYSESEPEMQVFEPLGAIPEEYGGQ
jgi:hypothetical protein